MSKLRDITEDKLRVPEFKKFVREIIKQVRLLAERKPKYRYNSCDSLQSCYYTSSLNHCVRENCGCIMGQAIMAACRVLGYDTEPVWKSLRIIDKDGGEAIVVVVKRFALRPSHRWSFEWMCRVQNEQDDGKTWGRAVQAADETYGTKLWNGK